MSAFLAGWTRDPQDVKGAFIALREILSSKEDALLTFKGRPGVSYSLRASLGRQETENRTLFALVDIIDDDAENRWLSICFYADSVTDPKEWGNLLPKGLLGEDGYCFDLHENDASLISYVKERIREARRHASKLT